MDQFNQIASSLRSRLGGKDCAICAEFKDISAKELFSWARPIASGVVVAAVAAYLVIFSYFEYTLVLFLCRVFQIGFATLGALVYTKRLTVTTENVRAGVTNALDNVRPIAANACDSLFRLLAWEQPGYSAPFLIGTIVLAFLSAYFEDAFLIFIVTLVAFGGTPLYLKYQQQIDPQVEKLTKEAKKLIKQIPIGKAKTA